MKVRYRFVTGEVSDVEVSAELADVLLDLDRQEHNNDQTETRRHISLDMMVEEQGVQFADAEQELHHKETIQAIRDHLLPRQRALIDKVFFQGHSIASIAQEECVNEAAIRNRLHKAYARAKKNL